MPSPVYSNVWLSREFAIIAGSLLLTILSMIVTFGTSYPLISKLIGPNAKALDTGWFNQISLPITILIALLIGLGQLLWFSRTDFKEFANKLIIPILLTGLTSLVLVIVGVRQIGMILLVMTSSFAFFATKYTQFT